MTEAHLYGSLLVHTSLSDFTYFLPNSSPTWLVRIVDIATGYKLSISWGRWTVHTYQYIIFFVFTYTTANTAW